MAAPGEFFPQQFALGVLQLSQNIKQRNAEIGEMRRARAERNFLDKERLALAARGQEIQAAQSGKAAANDAATDQIRVKQADAQLAFDQRRAKIQDAGIVSKAVSDFQNQGAAFFPQFAMGEAGKLFGGADTIHEKLIPGLGVLVTRVGSNTAPEYEKKVAEIQKIQSETALREKQSEATDSLRQLRDVRTRSVGSAFGKGFGLDAARKLQTMQNGFNARLNAFKAERMGLLLQNVLLDDPRIKELDKKISLGTLDIRTILPENERKLLADAEIIAFAAISKDADAVQAGEDIDAVRENRLSGISDVDGVSLQAAAGDAITMDEVQIARKVNPEAPAESLPIDQVFNQRFRGRNISAGFHVARDGLGMVPVTPDAVVISAKGPPPGSGIPDIRSQLHPAWKQLVRGGGKVKRGARAGSPGPAPSTAAPGATTPPESVDIATLETEANKIAAQLLGGDVQPDQRAALQARLDEIIATVEQQRAVGQ